MNVRWQISVGRLSDVLLPALVAFAIACSAWVLADARRRALARPALVAWTLGTLVLPFTVLPLYLLARLWSRATARADPDAPTTQPTQPLTTRLRACLARHAPTLLYAAVVALIAALYFAHDYRSLDARLARASDANLHGWHDRAAREYRAALQLVDDPHTHKLLALELVALQQWDAALVELRAAERGGEPDAVLPYHIANALDALDHREEASNEYQKFLAGDSCTQPTPDGRCARARGRLQSWQDVR